MKIVEKMDKKRREMETEEGREGGGGGGNYGHYAESRQNQPAFIPPPLATTTPSLFFLPSSLRLKTHTTRKQ